MPTPASKDPFRSARLTYRAIRIPEDAELFAAINDDRAGYMNSNASNIKLPGAADAAAFQKSVSEELLGCVICLAPDEEGGTRSPLSPPACGAPIGQVQLKKLAPQLQHHRFSEIGIDILPPYQGHGYGSEAIRWALDYAFRRAGLHRVNIRAFGWNEGALRLYRRLGFTEEGRKREELWHEGRWWDGVEFGMLDREWWELQKEADQ
jgi:RimJ/RimL family protein N-acetyltransferase